jgi:large subunit ribosomal protein L10
MKTRAQRQHEIESLAEEFHRAPHLVILGYQGVTVAKDWILRRKLQQANIRLRVVKNTLARQAARGTPVELLSEHFKGMTAIAFTHDDPVALAKILTEFARENAELQFKAALVEGRPMGAREIEAVATLPSKPELMASLMGLINAPTRSLMSVLTGVTRNLVVLLGQIRDQMKPETESS